MASSMLTIGASGAKAARAALDVTAQNIANASSEGYVRRGVTLTEVSAANGVGRIADLSFSGVRVSGISRFADAFRQGELRRTTSDAARAGAELEGLRNVESALEQSNLFSAIVEFEGALQQLATDPVDPSLRAAVLGAAENMANGFNLAANSLDAVGETLRFETGAEVSEANIYAGELARINTRLLRVGEGTADRATLLDQRDGLLEKLSGLADVATDFDTHGRVTVAIGGETLVTGNQAGTLSLAANADGTLGYALGGNAITLKGGALAGRALALEEVARNVAALDSLADDMAASLNAVQAGGVALDGSSGQPLFSGSGAAGLRLALANGAGLATAPAGVGAGSRDGANLVALRDALASGKVADRMNGLIFDISNVVAGREVTSEALNAIASAARTSFLDQAGVDLEQEAANLVRYQQAFQASGRVIQVASDIFDTILGIR